MSEQLQSNAEQPATDYPAAARVIHLHLGEFCDEELPYPEMIAVAARRAAREIATLRGSLQIAQGAQGVAVRLSYCPLCGARVILIASGPSVIAGMDSTPDQYIDARRLPAHVPHRCQSDDVKAMANIYDSAAAKYRTESE